MLFQREKQDPRLTQPTTGTGYWEGTLHSSACLVCKTMARRLAYSTLGHLEGVPGFGALNRMLSSPTYSVLQLSKPRPRSIRPFAPMWQRRVHSAFAFPSGKTVTFKARHRIHGGTQLCSGATEGPSWAWRHLFRDLFPKKLHLPKNCWPAQSPGIAQARNKAGVH